MVLFPRCWLTLHLFNQFYVFITFPKSNPKMSVSHHLFLKLLIVVIMLTQVVLKRREVTIVL